MIRIDYANGFYVEIPDDHKADVQDAKVVVLPGNGVIEVYPITSAVWKVTIDLGPDVEVSPKENTDD